MVAYCYSRRLPGCGAQNKTKEKRIYLSRGKAQNVLLEKKKKDQKNKQQTNYWISLRPLLCCLRASVPHFTPWFERFCIKADPLITAVAAQSDCLVSSWEHHSKGAFEKLQKAVLWGQPSQRWNAWQPATGRVCIGFLLLLASSSIVFFNFILTCTYLKAFILSGVRGFVHVLCISHLYSAQTCCYWKALAKYI